jgi:hypothetical protein
MWISSSVLQSCFPGAKIMKWNPFGAQLRSNRLKSENRVRFFDALLRRLGERDSVTFEVSDFEPSFGVQMAREARMDGKTGHSRTPDKRPERSGARPERTPEYPRTNTRPPRPITVRPPSGVVEWLAQQGGRAETSRRRLATALGRSPSGVHDELHRLVASGAITMTAGRRGTLLALRPNRPSRLRDCKQPHLPQRNAPTITVELNAGAPGARGLCRA